jgi:hypothetical protein
MRPHFQLLPRASQNPACILDRRWRLKEKTDKLTLDVAAQIEKVFFERFREITSEVGNAIDMKGAPFTLEAYLDSMERVDIDFDMFGFPEFPTQVMHLSMVATY